MVHIGHTGVSKLRSRDPNLQGELVNFHLPSSWRRGGGADLTKIQPAGIRTKSGGARSIEAGKGPAGSGLSLGVAGVENGGRKDATFLRPPW